MLLEAFCHGLYDALRFEAVRFYDLQLNVKDESGKEITSLEDSTQTVSASAQQRNSKNSLIASYWIRSGLKWMLTYWKASWQENNHVQFCPASVYTATSVQNSCRKARGSIAQKSSMLFNLIWRVCEFRCFFSLCRFCILLAGVSEGFCPRGDSGGTKYDKSSLKVKSMMLKKLLDARMALCPQGTMTRQHPSLLFRCIEWATDFWAAQFANRCQLLLKGDNAYDAESHGKQRARKASDESSFLEVWHFWRFQEDPGLCFAISAWCSGHPL